MGSEPPGLPELHLFDRQSSAKIDTAALRRRAISALPLCLASPPQNPSPRPLADLAEIEITFIDDAEIARVHLQFMDISGATDVITFDHGEIVISTETAARRAPEFGHDLQSELTLYIIHGLLHLNGHEDSTGHGAAEMRSIQERILIQVTGSG